MAEPEGAASRKNASKTRGRPFERGNAGRPQGSRNRVTIVVEKLLEAEAENIARAAVEFAKAGDTTLIKAVLDRVAPARREATINIDLPAIKSPADAPVVIANLLAKVAAGELAPSEATAVAGLLEQYRRQSELADLEARLTALEAAAGKR